MHADTSPLLPSDAFGSALARCVRHDSAPNETFFIAERDDGFVTAVDMAAFLHPPHPGDTVEALVVERAAGRVLDVGCGGGRHALAISQRGLDVVGVDASPGAVAVCRARGVDARPGSALFPGVHTGTFNTIVLGGQNLGLLESRPMAKRVLASLAAAAAPGARLLGTSTDPHAAKNPAHLAYMERNRERGRLPGQDRLRGRYDNTATDWFEYLYLSVVELTELLADSPWDLHDVVFSGPMFYFAELHLSGRG
jgi:SAM-dependent methyltransferase